MREKIVQLFPIYKEHIDFLFQTNENFRDLCSDYMLCTSMTLDRETVQNKKKEDIIELEAIQHGLEAEILEEIIKQKELFQ